MKLLCITLHGLGENTYIYYDENTLEGVVVDPGEKDERIAKAITDNKIVVKGILLTHGHFDHIGGVAYVKSLTRTDIYAAQAEDAILCGTAVKADYPLQDNAVLSFNNFKLKMIHTPGHTCGSCCYYDEQNGVIFTGDTLFYRDIGRTDLKTGNYGAIIDSVKSKLFTLPDNVIVYPGHGQSSAIGGEKQGNPYV